MWLNDYANIYDEVVQPILNIKNDLTLQDEDEDTYLSNFILNVYPNNDVLEFFFSTCEQKEMIRAPPKYHDTMW